MDEYTHECSDCGWSGIPADLHCSDEDFESSKPVEETKFDRCPDCGSQNIIEVE